MVKEVINNVVWVRGLSNRVESTSIVPNAGQRKLPDSVVHWVSDSFAKGVQKTTIPFLQKLQDLGQGGWEKVEGNEETPKMRFKQINYNLQRKGLTVSDESVEGDLTEYYAIASQKVQLLTDYFTELTDYNFQRAMTRGADEYLTETRYWLGETLTTPPVTASHHPSIFVNGGSDKVAYSAVDATYDTAIEAAADDMAVTNSFGLAELDSMVFLADSSKDSKLQKLSWTSGGGSRSINYVGKLTEQQARQLTTATGAGTWRELMSDAGSRGVDNRAITGVLGNYKRTLWIVDERAPLMNVAATTPATRFQYYKIQDERVPLPTTGAGNDDGTAEVAVMMGKAAIGAAKIKDLDFVNKDFDYGFSHGLAASQSCGAERMDLVNTAISTRPLNQSSFLYLTATPANEI